MGEDVEFEEIDITKDRNAADRFSVTAVPKTIVFDAEGVMVDKPIVGMPQKDQVAVLINNALSNGR